MKSLSITSSVFDTLVRRGWVDYSGRSMTWNQHQREGHDSTFEEPRERKPGKVKFKKEVR